jgi:hypothetical protein
VQCAEKHAINFKEKRKMKTSKTKISSIALLVLMLASTMLLANTQVKAQLAATQPTPGPLPSGVTPSITVETLSFLSFSPNPIGVNQELLVNIWMQPPINVQRQFINCFQVTITKPDGTKDVVGPLGSYAGDATQWFPYIPDQVGNYTLKFEFLGMYYPEGRYFAGSIVTNTSGTQLNSAYYQPSSTKEQLLVVQQDMVASWPPSPLPTDYWTRPVSPNNREWWTILGNYPPTGYGPAIYAPGGSVWDKLYPGCNPYWNPTANFVPYVQAPNTAHVVWKRQGEIGGLLGGVFGDLSLRPDPGYPAIIYAGRCYQTLTKVFNGVTQTVWQCYDLRTGQIYWEKTESSNFNLTQIPTMISYTERTSQAVAGEEAMMRGLTAELLYIGGGRMIKYNPWTGAATANVSISPLTTGVYYLHEYALSIQDLGASAANATGGRYRLINWTTNGASATFSTRIISNISYPMSTISATGYGYLFDNNAAVAVYVSAINPSTSVSGTGVSVGQQLVGVSLTTGQILWNVSTYAADGHEQFFSSLDSVCDNGLFIARMLTGDIRAWDIFTGKVKWSTPLSYPWGEFGPYHVASAYGLYITGSYAGVYAINETTGKIQWNFHAYTPYQFETPYQTGIGSAEYAFHIGVQVADGKVYISSAEHTPSQPETRGTSLYCIDVFTGEQKWSFYASQMDQSRTFEGAIADGYLAFANQLDSTMYVFGKGKSATTIDAPLTAVTLGQTVVLKGTVLDQSPGQPGTPCISPQSMGPWMNYLHAQAPIPTDVVGVQVSIDAVDPNGNSVHIADVTSDMSGTFSYMWKPDLAGKYTVTATFRGDDSYGSSYAETAVGVVNAPEPAVTPTPSTIVAATPTDVMNAALIVAVAVIVAVAAATVLLFKRRP